MKTLIAFILIFTGCGSVATTGDVISDTVKKDTSHKPVVVYDTTHKPWCCKIDTTHTTWCCKVDTLKKIDTTHTTFTINDTAHKTWCCKVDTLKKDTTVYRIAIKDSIRWNFIIKDSILIHVTNKDSIIWHLKDSTIINYLPKDSIVINYLSKDSIVIHFVNKDSIVWHYINKDSIIQPIDTTPKAYVLFGVIQQQSTVADDIAMLQRTGLKCIRTQVYFANNFSNNIIDQYLQNGCQVQINFNYKPTATATPYPTDTAFIRKQARAFFAYYKKWIKQIPVVVCENEWDNKDYHGYDIAPYLVELAIVVDEGHKQGFLIADAGFTSGNLKRWIYSQLTGIEQAQWKEQYTVVINSPENPFDSMLNQVKIFLNGIKTIPLDYLNVHWYNTSLCFNGLPKAAQLYLKGCNKTALISNEFGIKVSDTTLLKNTINELRTAGIKIGIAYSGIDAPNLAIRLSDDQLKLLIQ
jgi:hypothetical protein